MRSKYVLGLACGLALASGVHAQQSQVQPKPVQTNYIYPPPLYQQNDISKSLNLNQDQINRLNNLTQKMQAQFGTEYGKLNTLDPAARFDRTLELNRQYYSTWAKGANDILNNDQRVRYQQLYQQYGGFNTLYDPEVQKRLSLTPEQMKVLRENAEWNHQQLQTIYGANDVTKATQMYNEYWKLRQDRFNKILTPQQLQVWREITGEPYTFQPIFTPRP